MVLTTREVRRLALALPEAEEDPQGGTASFRVGEHVFATLHTEEKLVILKLSKHEQKVLGHVQPDVFKLTAWGHQGWTSIELRRVDPWLFEELLTGAWRRVASRQAIALFEAGRRL